MPIGHDQIGVPDFAGKKQFAEINHTRRQSSCQLSRLSNSQFFLSLRVSMKKIECLLE